MHKAAFNFYGGFTQSTIRSNIPAELGNRAGLGFGLGLDLRLSRNLWIGFDLLEVERNFSVDDGVVSNYDLAYIELPVKLRYVVGKNLHLFAGPYLASYLVSALESSQGNVTGVKNNFTNDYGVTVGGWLGIHPSETVQLGVDVRYDIGFADIRNTGVPYDFTNTRTLLVMATFGFKIK